MNRADFIGTPGRTGGPNVLTKKRVLRKLQKGLDEYLTVVQYCLYQLLVFNSFSLRFFIVVSGNVDTFKYYFLFVVRSQRTKLLIRKIKLRNFHRLDIYI